jgi:hypothetical protein
LKAIIIFLNGIKNFCFSSRKAQYFSNDEKKINANNEIIENDELCICTGSGKIYFWTEEGPMVCEMPFEGRVLGVGKAEWGAEGKIVIWGEKGESVVASFDR